MWRVRERVFFCPSCNLFFFWYFVIAICAKSKLLFEWLFKRAVILWPSQLVFTVPVPSSLQSVLCKVSMFCSNNSRVSTHRFWRKEKPINKSSHTVETSATRHLMFLAPSYPQTGGRLCSGLLTLWRTGPFQKALLLSFWGRLRDTQSRLSIKVLDIHESSLLCQLLWNEVDCALIVRSSARLWFALLSSAVMRHDDGRLLLPVFAAPVWTSFINLGAAIV